MEDGENDGGCGERGRCMGGEEKKKNGGGDGRDIRLKLFKYLFIIVSACMVEFGNEFA